MFESRVCYLFIAQLALAIGIGAAGSLAQAQLVFSEDDFTSLIDTLSPVPCSRFKEFGEVSFPIVSFITIFLTTPS